MAIILITVITITGEYYAPLKDWLKNVFTHHWLGKGALAIIIFILISLISYRTSQDEEKQAGKFLTALFYVSVLATVLFATFFYYHGR